MNTTKASEALLVPLHQPAPRHVVTEHHLASLVLWVPTLAVVVSLSLHRIFAGQPESLAFKVVAHAALLVVLLRVGHQSDLWETRP
jgi:hypothetical protein